MMTDRATMVAGYVAGRLEWLRHSGHTVAATLARLRRGIGRAPGDMPELWNVTLDGMPEELRSRDGKPTKGEWAVYTALTLYALHQQGRDMQKEPMNREGVSLGTAMHRLTGPDELDRIKRRFDSVATSDDIVELANHLRGVTQLLKAAGIPLDYPMLAKDLYWYQFADMAPAVRLRWGQDFYPVFMANESEATDEQKG